MTTVPDGGTTAMDAKERLRMYQPTPPQLLAVANATIAERRAEADRARLIRLVPTSRRPKLFALPTRPAAANVIRLFDRTPPTPEAA